MKKKRSGHHGKTYRLLSFGAIFAVVVGFAFGLNGCSENAPAPTVKKKEVTRYTFSVPKGWKTKTREGSTYRATKWGRTEDTCLGNVGYSIAYVQPGTIDDAKRFIQEETESEKANGATFSEVRIAGRTAYVSAYRTAAGTGCLHWENIIAFEKNGWMISLGLSDRLVNQREALDLLVKTFKVEWEWK